MYVSTQIFAIQLLSYLCTQYALPKSLSVARLAISVMGTLLTGESTAFLVSASHTFMLVVCSLLHSRYLRYLLSIIDFAPSRLTIYCKPQCNVYTVRLDTVDLSQHLAATIWPLAVSAALSLHYIQVYSMYQPISHCICSCRTVFCFLFFF